MVPAPPSLPEPLHIALNRDPPPPRQTELAPPNAGSWAVRALLIPSGSHGRAITALSPSRETQKQLGPPASARLLTAVVGILPNMNDIWTPWSNSRRFVQRSWVWITSGLVFPGNCRLMFTSNNYNCLREIWIYLNTVFFLKQIFFYL